MRMRNYDPLRVPKPDPEWKYFWASRNINSPQYIGAMKAEGYQTVPAKEAEKLGYDTSSMDDGGMVDKGHNCIGTPDLILMKMTRDGFDRRTAEKNADMLAIVGKRLSEQEENAEKVGALLKE